MQSPIQWDDRKLDENFEAGIFAVYELEQCSNGVDGIAQSGRVVQQRASAFGVGVPFSERVLTKEPVAECTADKQEGSVSSDSSIPWFD